MSFLLVNLNECISKASAGSKSAKCLQATYPAFGVGTRPYLSEVHLRRLDVDEYLHRRAVAVITIGASLQEAR